ncbi:MAG: ribosomal protein S18-alanine N-acetyltransferase [Dehalococcoidia bacterium]|nr:ribosomal protein S18-alanine N-acetyltransferase [Dehalococcoidia bacterium]
MKKFNVPLKIRDMIVTDISAVKKLESAAFEDAWPQRIFETELDNGFAQYRVALELKSQNKRRTQNILGYTGVWFMVDQLHLVSIAIHPNYQRSGMGERLMFDVVDQANAALLPKIVLEVRKSNLSAQLLYEKFGFKKIGELKNYYKDNHEDAVIMLCKLDAHEQKIQSLIEIHQMQHPHLWT